MSKKRGNGEGTIYQRKDGSWCGQLLITDPITGNTKRKTSYGKTRKIVQEKLFKTKQDVEKGINIEPTKTTVSEWMEIWLNDYNKSNLKPSTWESYRSLIHNYICPRLGRKKLKELQVRDIQMFYNSLSESKQDGKSGLSPRTIQYIHFVFNKALDQAVSEGLLIKNPCKSAKIPLQAPRKITPLNSKQAKHFLDCIQEDWLYPLFFMELRTGLRRGELLGLQWQDLNFENKTISISRSLIEVKGKAHLQESTKTKSSSRTMRISDDLVKILKKYRSHQMQEKFALGISHAESDFIFSWPDGRFINPSYLYHHFKKLLKKYDLPEVRFHDLRHTFATMLLEAGENTKVVSDMLGHSTTRVTMDIYSHVSLEMQGNAVSKIDDFLRIQPSCQQSLTGINAL